MSKTQKTIVIDARIRRASTGKPVERLLEYLPSLDKVNNYKILIEPGDPIKFSEKNFQTVKCKFKQFSFNIFDQFAFSKFLKKQNADLVFFTLTAQAPLLYKGKSITFTHDLTMLRFARKGKLPAWQHAIRMIGYRQLFKSGNKKATKIIVPSNFVKSDLSNYLPTVRNKISVIHEASEPPILGSPENMDIKKPFIFHVGSPFPHKNIRNLVLAFENLKKTYPDLRLVLAGKREFYFNQLQKWLEGRKFSGDIIIPGYISNQELKWLYQNAELYVLPSLSEGFGLPGLEAMAHKCPLASSNATCLPEIYGDAAIYFDPENTEEISSAISSVLSSDKRQRELVVAGQKQIKKYSFQKMSKDIHKILMQNI